MKQSPQRRNTAWPIPSMAAARCAPLPKKGCVIGTQFHPEKSGPVGLGIIKAYLDLCARAE